ncbi:MAG: hypothetical protein NTZ93_04220 [Candidatus Beckwithbacteria bacterium]|nr:hypothetical protein [Candidatus Beckwithbacteria bacterium]
MLLALAGFILAAVFLFLSSQALLSRLFRLLPLNLLFFILLPGIFLHEMSHILMAEILGIRTGELKLRPELKDNHLSLGSAQIGQTDPFRMTLIGLAPLITGATVLWLLIKFNPGGWWLILFGYLMFAVSNTLFSSPSDLQSAGVPVILILLLLGILQLTRLSFPIALLPYLANFFSSLATVFTYTLIINLVLLLPLKLLLSHHSN